MAVLIALGCARSTLLGIYCVLSLTLFVVCGIDKAAARRGRRRIPEMALHLISVAGGWPGGLVAQHVFHHKTRKKSFQLIFWCTVIVNCLALAYLWVALPALAR